MIASNVCFSILKGILYPLCFLLTNCKRWKLVISRFINKKWYNGLIRNGNNVKSKELAANITFQFVTRYSNFHWNFSDLPLQFVGLDTCKYLQKWANENRNNKKRYSRKVGYSNSWVSECEGNKVVEIIKELVTCRPSLYFDDGEHAKKKRKVFGRVKKEESFSRRVKWKGKRSDVLTPGNIGVISFYKEQVKALRIQLEVEGLKEVEVSTVDAFQGREKDVIIISMVRETHSSHLRDARRVNVALSRAKHGLIVVNYREFAGDGDFAFMEGMVSICQK